MEHLRYGARRIQAKPIFSYWQIVLALVVILVLFIYLFPGPNFLGNLINQKQINEVDFKYAVNYLSTKNDNFKNIEKFPQLAVQQFINEADEFQNNQDQDALWLHYIVLKSIALTTNFDKQTRVAAAQGMNKYFIIFKTLNNSDQQLNQLAEDALAIKNTQTALAFYEEILTRNPHQPIHFYVRLAEIATWAKDCKKSTDFYFIAKNKALNINDKRFLYFAGLKSLAQCDLYPQAFDYANKNIAGLENDPQTYEFLTDYAIKAGKPAMAEEYLLKALKLKNAGKTENTP